MMERKKHTLFLHTILCLALNSIVIFSSISYIYDLTHRDYIEMTSYTMLDLLTWFFLPLLSTVFVFIMSFVTLMFGILQEHTLMKNTEKADLFGMTHRILVIATTILTFGSVFCTYCFMFYNILVLEWADFHIVEHNVLAPNWNASHILKHVNWIFPILLVVLILVFSVSLVKVSIVNVVTSKTMKRRA